MGRKILDLDFKCSKCWTPGFFIIYLAEIIIRHVLRFFKFFSYIYFGLFEEESEKP